MRNASVTARLVIVCFLLCWTPYICNIIYSIADPSIQLNKERWFLYFNITVVTIALVSCGVVVTIDNSLTTP